MISEEVARIVEVLASMATVAAFLAVAFEIRKSRQIESRSQILETRKMFQDLYEYRKLAGKMSWENYSDFKRKYPVDSHDYWASQVVLEFFDMVGDSVRNRELEEGPMIRLWGSKATFYWWKFKDIIMARNQEFNISAFEDLEWLAEETIRIYPQLKPEIPFQGNIPAK